MLRIHPVQLALFAAVSLAAGTAHASDRVQFDLATLGRVQKVENGLDRVRVYPSRRVVIQRSTLLSSDTSVDGSVDTVLEGKDRKDILARGSAGKILAVEPVVKVGSLVAHEGAYRLFVSFDPNCTTRECAFVFENPVLSNYNIYEGGYVYAYRNFFMLAAIPEADGAPQVDEVILGRKPIFWNGVETNAGDGTYPNVFDGDLILEVKLNELVNIEKETVKHGGWND